jgi:uncharacterized protein (DUF433 family)
MTFQKPEPRPATPAAQTVVLLETILGPVQAALLALAIRRKFMANRYLNPLTLYVASLTVGLLTRPLPQAVRTSPPSWSGFRLSARLCYHLPMDYTKIITIEPGKRSGKPCIRGTRMTVTDVLEYLAGGMTEEEILAEFPDLTAEDIKACLAFAADRERKLATLPQYETAV